MRTKKIVVFVALTFLLAWPLGFGFFALGGEINSPAFIAMALLYMFTPAAAALITHCLLWKEPLRDLGFTAPAGRWLIVAWLLPVLLVLAALALSLALPHVTLEVGLDGVYRQLADRLSPSQIAAVHRKLDGTVIAVPGALIALSFFQVLTAGPTLNAIAALGEELGWRGLLFSELRGLGFWTGALVTGLIWGVWHLPLIAHGFNYPGHPLAGVAMMTLLTILLSPLIAYVRIGARSVVAPAVFHGTFNAAATLVLFLRGGDVLLTGVTGTVGLLTLLCADVCLWFLLRGREGTFAR